MTSRTRTLSWWLYCYALYFFITPELWCPRLSFLLAIFISLFMCVFQDWNQMLSSLAELKFCTQLNDTDLLDEKPDMNSIPLLDHADELNHNLQQKSEVISMFLLVPLMYVGDYLDHNSISTTLLGNQLGLKGKYTGFKRMQTTGVCSGFGIFFFLFHNLFIFCP